MFVTKKRTNDKNDKNFHSNLILYEPDQSTKIAVRTLGVKEDQNEIHFTYFMKSINGDNCARSKYRKTTPLISLQLIHKLCGLLVMNLIINSPSLRSFFTKILL